MFVIKEGEAVHKVFISYHHPNDEHFKNQLVALNILYDIFLDYSTDTSDVDGNLDDAKIGEIIRDEYLLDSTVTILLVGTETRNRKQVDWEIYSSMLDGTVNKRSGILVVNLPTVNCSHFIPAHKGEKESVYPDVTHWEPVHSRTEYESQYPYMPARIIDNLLNKDAKISVVNWNRIIRDPDALSFLIDVTYKDKSICNYDLNRPMRKSN